MYDRRSGTIMPAKGTGHPYCGRAVLQDIESLGYKRVVVKSDQEVSLIALTKSVRDAWTGEMVLEHPPKGQSRSNGEVERAVQSVHGLARTLKESLEQGIGEAIDAKAPIVAWLIEHAGTLLNLFSRSDKQDGMTAYMRLRGRPWRIPLPAFGETVEFMRRTRHKLESRWEPGVFLGIREHTTEKIVGTAEGIYVVQSIRRKPEGERYNADLVKGIRGLPWLLKPEDEAVVELPEPITLRPEMPEAPAAPVQGEQRAGQQYRKHYIVKKDLEKYGYTAACPACDASRMGQRPGGVAHTQICRERIEKALAEDPERRGRLERTEMRQNQRVADEIAQDEERKRPRQEAIVVRPPPGLEAPAGASPMVQEGGSSGSGSRPEPAQLGGQGTDVPSTLAVPARRREDRPEGGESPAGRRGSRDPLPEPRRELWRRGRWGPRTRSLQREEESSLHCTIPRRTSRRWYARSMNST
jgi:hypothetical protein